MIRRVKGGWQVFSMEGKPLSKVLPTIEGAKKRLAQVESFKKRDMKQTDGEFKNK
jgi:hypothetical protein